MEIFDFMIIMLIILALVLFIISRNYLKNTMKAATRAGQLEEMTKKVLKYEHEGKGKNETIENLMRDFD
ncbi:hypothetical protein [Salinicoccus sp. HZC-1]|uniref:hypothetical protein n=1 Tax=Salinicoccus sp. HZC-1 TaxID=3385497 RepID=UPI00398AAAEF